MSTKANLYLDQQLAASGFAIQDSVIACTLRGDLWTSGMEASADFAPSRFRLKDRPGVRRFSAVFKGRESRPVVVLARNADHLAMRIEWVTGLTVLDLYEEATGHQAPTGSELHLKPRQEVSDDVHAGVLTKEPGRTCGDCEHITAGGRCKAYPASGIERPVQRALRRCVTFAPLFESMDSRTGRQLWPELTALEKSQ